MIVLFIFRCANLAVLNGQELAIGQAVDAFALFFGRPAPIGVMRSTFEREIQRRESNARLWLVRGSRKN